MDKESLSFTPSQLAGIGVWLTALDREDLFAELVDTVADVRLTPKTLHPHRRVLMATGLLILAGVAGINFPLPGL